MKQRNSVQDGDVFDAVIVGAGPSGGMTALKLAQAGWKVLLADKSAFPREKVCGGFIGPENRPLLEQTGVWGRLNPSSRQILREMWLTSPKGASVRMSFPAAAGLAVSRIELDQAIAECAVEEGAFFAPQSQVVKTNDGVFVLKQAGGKEIKIFARHAVDARGGIALEETEIMGFGMSAYFENVRWMKNRVILHFAREGHFGLDPVSAEKTTGCFVATQAMLEKSGKNPEKLFEEFMRQNRFLAAQMKGARRLSAWQGIPIRLSAKPVFFKDGFFRAGDTVATVDPVVGGGMTLALQGAVFLADTLAAYEPGRIPEEKAVREYSRLWKKSFGLKLPLSHFWGWAGHQPGFAEGLLRLLGWQRSMLTRLFEWHHAAMPQIGKLEKAI